MVGGPSGRIQIWDLEKSKKIEDFFHSNERQRVGVMDWKDEYLFTTGSKDCTVISRFCFYEGIYANPCDKLSTTSRDTAKKCVA